VGEEGKRGRGEGEKMKKKKRIKGEAVRDEW
jgi:hypothetical protein